MKVRIFVRLKPGVLDPQGRAVHHSLEGMGFDGVEDVRIGRLIELDVAEDTSDETLKAMCEKLGIGDAHVSLSDDAGLIVAFAVVMNKT